MSRTVLVVDDSRAVRVAARRILEEAGYHVREAANGVEALDLFARGLAPDGVLLDLDMPEMDGLTFLERLRADPLHRGVVVVMCTTAHGADTVRSTLAVGADEYVMKPFTADILRWKLQRAGLAP